MSNMANSPTCDIGIVGLAVMGSNLALNIAEKGFKVAVYNRTYARTEEFLKQNSGASFSNSLCGYEDMSDFVNALKLPRKVLILVQAGAATDATIQKLSEYLQNNDIIVDTGNAHFRDQSRRAEELESRGLRFLGMGISGGEEGARKGPAFFPGGTLSVWEEVKPIIEAAAAKASDGKPCVTMNGKGGAGSCVKMYHNAGEYAVLEVWSEVVSILLQIYQNDAEKVIDVLQDWKRRTTLDSYMLDVTIEAVGAKEGSENFYKMVTDKIGSKGTGLWSVVEALDSGVPVPSLSMAVTARQMSMQKEERIKNEEFFKPCANKLNEADLSQFKEDLYHATLLSILASYSQMFQCLRVLDCKYKFGLKLPSTISTFRAGCILQGHLLQPITAAFEKNPDIPNLLCAFTENMESGLPRFGSALSLITRTMLGPAPVLQASFAYIHTMFSGVLVSAQITQLQRDVFGRHGFERLDKPGTHNHTWRPMQ